MSCHSTSLGQGLHIGELCGLSFLKDLSCEEYMTYYLFILFISPIPSQYNSCVNIARKNTQLVILHPFNIIMFLYVKSGLTIVKF